ncbi:QbdB [hydrothermal vent metagenome]|uniref:QbdB n=1 Tax=hydrothermal vent metagenome TaxID=652676 RepID=A0A1W1CS43_9ZZZZ
MLQKALLFFYFSLLTLHAQSLEPRLYTNVPTDLNFVVLGASHSEGALPSNSALIDPKLNINTTVFAYARSLNIAGHSAKLDLVIPAGCIDGTATLSGNKVSRDVCGLADIKTRLAFNIFGAPATSLKNFSSYEQDTILGMSLQVTLPTGQYDKSKLVNISANRWALKLGTGVSKKINSFLFEVALDAEYYTQNNDFLGQTRQQDIIYSSQIHLIYLLQKGVWFGVDANYYIGGENTQNDVKLGDALDNSRYGATFSFPLSRTNSIKITASSGIFARAGSNFDTIGVFWQYHFVDNF